jgi:hypothetical protein
LDGPCPEEPVQNVLYRLAVWDKALKDKAFQKAILAKCRGSGERDVEALRFYTNTFVWQHNPAMVGREVGPFILRPYQIRAAREILDTIFADRPDEVMVRADVVVEKSREMGATWEALDIADKLCRFHDYKDVLVFSHTEKAVEKSGDSKTLFYKLRFIHDRLPEWLQRGVRRTKMTMYYPETKSSITGESSTKRTGVGGRVTLAILDEFGLQKEAEAIWGNTASTGPRLVISTHYGVGTMFYKLCYDEQFRGVKKVRMHWSEHPEFARGAYQVTEGRYEVLDKSYRFTDGYHYILDGSPTGGPYPGLRSAWYDAECVRRGSPRDVRQHLDIDPAGAEDQVFDPLIIRRLRSQARRHVWEGEIKNGQLVRKPFGQLKLWVQPDTHGNLPPGRYAVACDVAQGERATPSCLAAIDAALSQRVAEFSTATLDPKEFADYVVAFCSLLKNASGRPALLAWEAQGPGGRFGRRVIELGYTHVYMNNEVLRVSAIAQSDRPGWNATPQSNQETIEDYRFAIQTGVLTEHCTTTLDECLYYRYGVDGRPEHPKRKAKGDPSGAGVNHGDRVRAAALCWKMACDLGTGRKPVGEAADQAREGGWLWRRQQAEKADQEAEAEWV